MARLDEFLRFLLMVSAMGRSRLLRHRALWDAYSYWFSAIWTLPTIREYVRVHYPVLFAFTSHRINSEISRRMKPGEKLGTASSVTPPNEVPALPCGGM
jgi:hypothetical protein